MKLKGGRANVSERAGGASVSFGELPLVLTVDEARRVLRIGRRQLYQAIARRDVHTLKVGRSIRIPRSSLEAWLAKPDHEPAQSVTLG
jgi:excisionase family DNA binding protein